MRRRGQHRTPTVRQELDDPQIWARRVYRDGNGVWRRHNEWASDTWPILAEAKH